MLQKQVPSQCRLPLPRSYGYILPSSLTRVLPRTLGFSPRIPVSVYGTGGAVLTRSFSRQCGVSSFGSFRSLRVTPQVFRRTDLPILHPTRLHRNNRSPACLPSCVTPSLKQTAPVQEYPPAVHLLRSMPRIRSRLTLGRRSLPRNPYAFGGPDSHRSFRYSYQHSHFPQVHRSFQTDFSPVGTLPYPTTYVVATASVPYFSPGNLRRRFSRPVSYYALFEWWLLLSQHPGCLGEPTSFST